MADSSKVSDLNIPNLKKLSSYIAQEKEVIATKWIKNDNVGVLFKKFKIEQEFFKKIFGIPVIEYFVGVVDGSKKLGDCPVMNKFVSFLMEMGVQARDIFILCMALRKTLIKHLYANKKITENTDIFLDEISDVFDTNLSGVLQIFSDKSIEREKELQKRKNAAKSQKRLQTILNLLENMICVVKDGRAVTANKAFLNALSVSTLEEFNNTYDNHDTIVDKIEINEKLFNHKKYDSWLDELVKQKDKTIKIYLHDKVADKTGIYILKTSKFPKSDSEYVLSFTDISEFNTKYEQLKTASALDPITKTYNAQKFEQTLFADILTANKEDTPLFVIMLDIDNFGLIIDRHNESTKNSILCNTANTVKNIIGENIFFARVRSGRFAMICKEYDISQCRELVKAIKKELDLLSFNISDKVTYSFVIVSHSDKESKHVMLSRAAILFEEIKDEGAGRVKDDAYLYEKQKKQKENESQILQELVLVSNAKKTLDATSLYKEIPISYKMAIKKIQNGTVTLEQKNEASFTFDLKRLFLSAAYLSGTIAADVVSCDPKKNMIVLSNFQYAPSSPLQRKKIRIIPNKEIYATVKNNACVITALIIDISLNSANLMTRSVDKLKTNDKVTTDFYIFKDDKEEQIIANGHIHNIKRVKNGYLIILIFNMNAANEKKLSEYISNQQMLTIRELKNLTYSYSI